MYLIHETSEERTFINMLQGLKNKITNYISLSKTNQLVISLSSLHHSCSSIKSEPTRKLSLLSKLIMNSLFSSLHLKTVYIPVSHI